MKNFKKLLVTLLALVLLICGATVVSLAADTPAEIIAEAQILLDQAAAEDGFIAVRSQKMRELDQLITANYSTIKNSQEWRDFQIGYRAAQEQLKEDSVAEATASLDRLLDKEISASEASALYSGLSQLISASGDGRGYFDTSSEAYAALNVRMKVARAIERLQTVEEAVVIKDKGASLLWVYEYSDAYLDKDAVITATEDYKQMKTRFDEIYDLISATLYAEITSLTDTACLPTTSFARGIAIVDEIDSYFTSCYFDTSKPEYTNARTYTTYARVYVYLNEIERAKGLVAQGTHLKTLVALREATVLDDKLDRYADFTARYDALLNTDDASSAVSRLCVLADGYKKDVSDVFADGYNGPLKDAAAIREVVDALGSLLATCYFPASSTYASDLSVATGYASIYDFYVAMKTMDTADDAFITRNHLYKAAVSAYTPLAAGVMNAEEAYKNPFLALYNDLIAKASAEIHNVLNGWLTTAQQCDVKDEAGEYKISLDDVMAAYNNLQTYYITKDTALYFRATEDKTMTLEIKKACQKVEERWLQTLNEELLAAKNLISIPDELATVDLTGLAAREERLEALLLSTDGLAFSYVDAEALPLFRHELIVAKMLTLLCKVEIEYAKGADGEAASVAFYNELKTFTADHIAEVDTAAKDYIGYLAYLNKTEVKMGNANVPAARPYLDALAAVVDADNFDKVYALMRLDEYLQNNKITRPYASDTTSASALFYKEYDELAGKVKAWRKAKADAREATVPLSDYSLTGINQWDMEEKAFTAIINKSGDVFIAEDKRNGGANGSDTCATIDYVAGGDTYINVSLPSSTDNIIFEMDLTTFTSWPKGGVSFNSKATGLTTGSDVWPWIGAITGEGQLKVPDGPSSGNRKVITDREGGYIIPGQWTHFVIVYNAAEKMVSYYINDEKIVAEDGTDSWSCALRDSWNFHQQLRIGNSQGGENAGSFSIDNLQIYVGDRPRNINLFDEMSTQERFVYYTSYAKKYIDSNGKIGTAADAKRSYDEAMALYSLYWGIPENGTEETYLFNETTYWDPTAQGYVDIGVTYDQLKQAVDDYFVVDAQADSAIDNAMVAECFNQVKTMVEKLKTLTGIANLTARQTLLDSLNTYIETNASYLARLNETDVAAYEQYLKDKDTIATEIEAYSRANEYIVMVNKFAAARDLYSRTVYRAQAQEMMKSMETDSSLGYFDLAFIKADVPEFAAAIQLFNEQSNLLDDQLIRDNNEIIIDCMGRFPATPEAAIKNYDYLNKYIVLARSVILEGNYDKTDAGVQEALVIYEKMNVLFLDALQKDHAATLQALIDQFNTETAYITRLGIYNATKSYLEQNRATIDRTHDAIKGIYSQYEIMETQFGSEAGREEEWLKYGETLQANTLKFVNIVTQMRFSGSYDELFSLREQAAAVYYYMDSTTADAQLAIEYYHTYEKLLTYKALCGDSFIDAAYALKKAKTMQETYLALLAAKAAYELADTTYAGSLTYTETAGDTTHIVTFSMQEAVETYTIALSQYNSFVTVINGEVNVVLDIVCAVRASFSVNQPIVALFKKYYD